MHRLTVSPSLTQHAPGLGSKSLVQRYRRGAHASGHKTLRSADRKGKDARQRWANTPAQGREAGAASRMQRAGASEQRVCGQ